jgi:hypothetical protein
MKKCRKSLKDLNDLKNFEQVFNFYDSPDSKIDHGFQQDFYKYRREDAF